MTDAMPQSELIERLALEDLHAAATEADRQSLGLFSIVSGLAFASIASRLPASAIVINRVLGLGLGPPAEKDEVREIISAYRSRDVSRFFVQLHPDHQPEDCANWLTGTGLTHGRGWQKFTRDRSAVNAPTSDLTVREVGPDQGPDFARIVCDAFDLGPLAVPWLARIPGRAGWRIFMSYDGNQPAGTGALFIHDDIAWTDFGATAPAFRRRGSQGTLMAARLECALDHGCRTIHTCTGVKVPGDPQHSYTNILKAGFRESYVRENYEGRNESNIR